MILCFCAFYKEEKWVFFIVLAHLCPDLEFLCFCLPLDGKFFVGPRYARFIQALPVECTQRLLIWVFAAETIHTHPDTLFPVSVPPILEPMGINHFQMHAASGLDQTGLYGPLNPALNPKTVAHHQSPTPSPQLNEQIRKEN